MSSTPVANGALALPAATRQSERRVWAGRRAFDREALVLRDRLEGSARLAAVDEGQTAR